MTLTHSRRTIYARIAWLGAIAGIRSMTAPALLSQELSKQCVDHNSIARLLEKPHIATMLTLLALGEVVADKMPGMPARTVAPAFFARIVSGTFVGATYAAVYRQRPAIGGVTGGATAAVATVGSYYLRRMLGTWLHIPDPVVGIIEDTVVLGSWVKLIRSVPA